MRVTLISAVGFFSDSADLILIGMVLKIMAKLYPQTTAETSMVSTTALVGSIFGQVVGGICADWAGRKKLFVASLVLIIFGMLASSVLVGWASDHNIYTQLAIFRFVLGIGIGMEYAIAPTIAQEHQGNPMLVFAMQGLGYLAASVLIFICLLLDPDEHHLEFTWRFVLGVCAIPSVCIFRARLMLMWSSQRDEFERAVDSESGLDAVLTVPSEPQSFWARQCGFLKQHNLGSPNWRWLIGTSLSWCLFDISWYANSLFAATIMTAMGLGNSLQDQALNSVYVALMGLPGYWVAYWLLLPRDCRFGLRELQIFGFLICAILFFEMSWSIDSMSPGVLIFIYGLTFFMSNVGPNSTTFVASVKIFPPQVRCGFSGISAASGKLGAVIGSALLAPIKVQYGVNVVLMICAIVMFAGMVVTILFLPRLRNTD